MNFQDFLKKYDGVGIDWDKAFGFQCMDLYRQYVNDVLGCPQSPAVRGAADVWDTYLKDYFDRVPNTPTGVPEYGDIVIWNKNAGGGFGHIAIFVSGTATSFTSFDQNWPVGSKCHKQTHYYKNVLGWLKFKGVQSSDYKFTQAQYDIATGERDRNWNLYQETKTKLDEANAEIDRLRTEVTNLNADLKREVGIATDRYQLKEKDFEALAQILGVAADSAAIIAEVKRLVDIETELEKSRKEASECQKQLKEYQLRVDNQIDKLKEVHPSPPSTLKGVIGALVAFYAQIRVKKQPQPSKNGFWDWLFRRR